MQILLFLLLVLAVLVVFVSTRDSLTKNSKIYLILSFILIVVLGWIFNYYSSKTAEHNREIVLAYEQGKPIECQGYSVNSKDFVYVSGTLSFVAKDNKTELKGVVLDISTCNKK